MRASDPATAAKQISRVPLASGGTPLAEAAFKPLPIPGHTRQASIRENNAPINHFQSSGSVPHMIHPNSGVGMPKVGSPMKIHVPGVK